MERRATWLFIGSAFGVAQAGQVAIWIGGGLDGPWFGRLAPVLMFAPAAAAFLATRREGGSFRRLLRIGLHPLPTLAAMLVPALSAVVTAWLVAGWLGGTPAPWQIVPGGVTVPPSSVLLWTGEQSWWRLAGNLLLSALGLWILAGALAIGEEIGWRGYLQPRLCRRFGSVTGLVAVGVLWAYWHLSIALMGYVFPHHPVIGALVLFPLVGIGLSLFLGWLREASGQPRLRTARTMPSSAPWSCPWTYPRVEQGLPT